MVNKRIKLNIPRIIFGEKSFNLIFNIYYIKVINLGYNFQEIYRIYKKILVLKIMMDKLLYNYK
jgi:hypothetical protein